MAEIVWTIARIDDRVTFNANNLESRCTESRDQRSREPSIGAMFLPAAQDQRHAFGVGSMPDPRIEIGIDDKCAPARP
jgi:hypothetical protein